MVQFIGRDEVLFIGPYVAQVAGDLDDATAAYIKSCGCTKATVLGGKSTVADSVLTSAKQNGIQKGVKELIVDGVKVDGTVIPYDASKKTVKVEVVMG